ncbi:hypothetical protein HDU92_007309 [Lobulomyces angularis]|nr:hypothetical protein HDU92_007309 [Lobulomyces angularis]
MSDLFSIPIFFVLFREATEAGIIVSVLLSYLNHVNNKSSNNNSGLKKQVWFGALFGFILSLVIGIILIAIFYSLQQNFWAKSELLFEGIFSVIAGVLLFFMGIAMLDTHNLKKKWEVKMNEQLNSTQVAETQGQSKWVSFAKKNFNKSNIFFWLPFVTLFREGLEAVVFLGGLSLGVEPKAIPIPAIVGTIVGVLIGFLVYKGGNRMSLRYFFAITSTILFFIGAGLFVTGVFRLESAHWNSLIIAVEGGDDVAVPTFDTTTNVFVMDWGSPSVPGSAYVIANLLCGWNSLGSIATILSYCAYWWALSITLVVIKLRRRSAEKKAAST